jgi:hypothetical protein
MTIGADFTQITHVLVVFEVTRHAFGFCRVKGRVFGVAILAFRFHMAVMQREIRQVMIKTLFDQAEHVGITTFMIGMTACTLALTDIRR